LSQRQPEMPDIHACDRLAAPLHAQFGELPPEEVLQIVKPDSGLRCVIVIDSTARGAALGGCRLLPYGTDQEALLDALRLARAMSMKNALAALPFGGGQAVICRPAGDFDRSELFSAFGRTVASIGGCYVAAADAGTTALDMLAIQRLTTYACATPRHRAEDHASKMAFGVFIAIEEGLQRVKRRLRGATIAVQGLAAAGMHLCERLQDSGARLVVADVDPARAREAAARFDARIVEPGRILAEPCRLSGERWRNHQRRPCLPRARQRRGRRAGSRLDRATRERVAGAQRIPCARSSGQ
jgi:leucine dehydrogenase